MEESRIKIRDYVQQTNGWVERYRQTKPPNEETTKFRHVTPFLELLGWEVHGEDVDWARTTFSGEEVDAALMANGESKIYVEIKPFNHELKEGDIKQIIKYARVDQVDWCLLTNGREIQVYHSAWEEEPGKPWLFFETSLQSFEEDFRKIVPPFKRKYSYKKVRGKGKTRICDP